MRESLPLVSGESWLLPALVLWPLAAALLVRIAGRDVSREEVEGSVPNDGVDARWLTLGALVIEAILGLALWMAYDPAVTGWQSRIDLPWLTDLGASFSVGVDGLSLPMVVLTVVLLPLTLLGSWNNVRVRTPAFGALVLLLTAGLVGVLVSLDLLLFYLAWELMLIPTYFLIGIWGTGAAVRASLRYVLFTLVGSLLMLVAIMALWNAGGGTSFHLDFLRSIPLDERHQLLMFGAFFLAFAVKSALVPFHTWLPDAQGSAPTFAAVTLGLKVGVYAMLRFAIPLFPAAALHPTVRGTILVLSVVAIVYGALVALSQRDVKRLVSYSSISHLGFIMLGVFALTPQSMQGAILIMINHGITTSALFLMAGMLQDRRGTTSMSACGGVASVAPAFSVFFTLAMLSTIGLPGTNGFVGEFLVLLGVYGNLPVLALMATSGVVFAAIYGLRALQAVLFDRLDTAANQSFGDLSRGEVSVLTVLAIGIVWMGIAPSPVLRRIEPAARAVIESAHFGLNAPAAPASVSITR
ncbi:MAG: NADH-quinone oxidoreductase subunit M [Gemmatimonadaceae bacterium]|nr:NADH-quinone oxidoreductase subunit M [Gemmatimonadaceae bacterium]